MHQTDPYIPYWEKLLLAWEEHGGAGLTVPFLAGARIFAAEGVAPTVEDAKNMLEDIFAKGVKDRTIVINWCGTTKAYGICIVKDSLADGLYLSTPASVFAIDLACQEFGSLPEEIIEGLTDLYSREITGSTYSITSGKWRAYDEADENFIMKALA